MGERRLSLHRSAKNPRPISSQTCVAKRSAKRRVARSVAQREHACGTSAQHALLGDSQRATLLAAPERRPHNCAISLCTLAELCAAATTILGLASFWFWILVQRTPFWYTLVEGDPPSYTPALADGYELVLVCHRQPRGGRSGGARLRVARRASPMVWPYTRVIRLRSVEFTRVSLCLWSLITAGILSGTCKTPCPTCRRSLARRPSCRRSCALVEAVDILAFFAGKVAMPICLLGVPLARSSALWRLASSHEEAVTYHRWLGAIAVVLPRCTIGYLVVWWQPGHMDRHVVAGLHSLYERLFSQEHGIRGLNPLCEGRICEA